MMDGVFIVFIINKVCMDIYKSKVRRIYKIY